MEFNGIWIGPPTKLAQGISDDTSDSPERTYKNLPIGDQDNNDKEDKYQQSKVDLQTFLCINYHPKDIPCHNDTSLKHVCKRCYSNTQTSEILVLHITCQIIFVAHSFQVNCSCQMIIWFLLIPTKLIYSPFRYFSLLYFYKTIHTYIYNTIHACINNNSTSI